MYRDDFLNSKLLIIVKIRNNLWTQWIVYFKSYGNYLVSLTRWSLYKFKYLWDIKGQELEFKSLKELYSHTFLSTIGRCQLITFWELFWIIIQSSQVVGKSLPLKIRKAIKKNKKRNSGHLVPLANSWCLEETLSFKREGQQFSDLLYSIRNLRDIIFLHIIICYHSTLGHVMNLNTSYIHVLMMLHNKATKMCFHRQCLGVCHIC